MFGLFDLTSQEKKLIATNYRNSQPEKKPLLCPRLDDEEYVNQFGKEKYVCYQ